jgi:polyphenol oxidase
MAGVTPPPSAVVPALTSPSLGCRHGFSLRQAGNLSTRVGAPSLEVVSNRQRWLTAVGLPPPVLLHQVHGSAVVVVDATNHAELLANAPTGDALVTASPDVALAIETADCYPIVFHDPRAGVIGAAHAGWRGTVAGIAIATIQAMQNLGASVGDIRVAIGPGIHAADYPVGPEVLAALGQAGVPQPLAEPIPGHADLAQANAWLLVQAGIRPQHLWQSGRSTLEADFFSYRRDRGATGRLWAVIAR